MKYKKGDKLFCFAPYCSIFRPIKITEVIIYCQDDLNSNLYYVTGVNAEPLRKILVHKGQIAKTKKALNTKIKKHLNRLIDINKSEAKILQKALKTYTDIKF